MMLLWAPFILHINNYIYMIHLNMHSTASFSRDDVYTENCVALFVTSQKTL
jgi:hypothetical protein